MRHDPGVAASPPVHRKLVVEEGRDSSRPPWAGLPPGPDGTRPGSHPHPRRVHERAGQPHVDRRLAIHERSTRGCLRADDPQVDEPRGCQAGLCLARPLLGSHVTTGPRCSRLTEGGQHQLLERLQDVGPIPSGISRPTLKVRANRSKGSCSADRREGRRTSCRGRIGLRQPLWIGVRVRRGEDRRRLGDRREGRWIWDVDLVAERAVGSTCRRPPGDDPPGGRRRLATTGWAAALRATGSVHGHLLPAEVTHRWASIR